MTEALLNELKKITPEELKILEGHKEIEKTIYMSPETDVIDAQKLLEAGKMIQVRTHTRFVHFPKHTHNFIEVIYMCSGSTKHVVNGEDVILKEGELLFLNQKATQEIYPAGENDIAVNFIILPEFFEYHTHTPRILLYKIRHTKNLPFMDFSHCPLIFHESVLFHPSGISHP